MAGKHHFNPTKKKKDVTKGHASNYVATQHHFNPTPPNTTSTQHHPHHFNPTPPNKKEEEEGCYKGARNPKGHPTPLQPNHPWQAS
jgi:hypothetical protein